MRFQTLSVFVLGLCTYFAGAEEQSPPNSNSTDYAALREEVAALDSTAQLIQTADALAEAGLHSEAIALLKELRPAHSDPPELPSDTRKQWRILSGADYYRLEDVNERELTPSELKELERLKAVPLAAWLRVQREIVPTSKAIDQITPGIYVSQHKGRFEVPVGFVLHRPGLKIETSGKLEKWFRKHSHPDSSLTPFQGQSSDMGGFSIGVRREKPYVPGKRFDFSFPIALDWEHYRINRNGYESYLETGLSPAFTCRFESLPITTRLTGEVRYENFYGDSAADSLDLLYLFSDGNAVLRNPNIRAELGVVWSSYRYTTAVSPRSIDRLEILPSVEYTRFGPIRPRVSGQFVRESERHSSPADFSPSGLELSITPSIELSPTKHLKVEPALHLEHRTNDREESLPWEPRTSLEPEMEVAVSLLHADLSIRAAFRSEDYLGSSDGDGPDKTVYPNETRYDDRDNRSIKLGGDVNFSLLNFITFTIFSEYQYRYYKPFDSPKRESENINISSSIAVAF